MSGMLKLQRKYDGCLQPHNGISWRQYWITDILTLTWHQWGTRWRSWLRNRATSRKVGGSIPDGVTGISQWLNPSGDSASNRNEYQDSFLGGKSGRCVGLTPADCLGILGVSTSWSPEGLPRPVMGQLYLFCVTSVSCMYASFLTRSRLTILTKPGGGTLQHTLRRGGGAQAMLNRVLKRWMVRDHVKICNFSEVISAEYKNNMAIVRKFTLALGFVSITNQPLKLEAWDLGLWHVINTLTNHAVNTVD